MDTDLTARFGLNVKQLREARGATQAQMAKLRPALCARRAPGAAAG